MGQEEGTLEVVEVAEVAQENLVEDSVEDSIDRSNSNRKEKHSRIAGLELRSVNRCVFGD